MVESGVDIVEIGVPYSDPLMDGPVIQHAAEAALARGSRLADVFTAVRAVADAGAPALVMTYWNPVVRYGVDRFADDLAAAGGAGLITPDLIPDEGAAWIAAAERNDLDRVFLVAPSSTDARLASTGAACRGFVYAASTMGVTGARTSVGDAAGTLVSRARAVTDLPICVGLGVSDRRPGRPGRRVRGRGHRRVRARALPGRRPDPGRGPDRPARADHRAGRRRPCRSLSGWGCATATGSSTSSVCWPASCWASCWWSPAP